MAIGAAAAAEVNWASSVLLLRRVELALGVIVASGTSSPSVAVGSSVAAGSSDAVAVSSGSVPGAMMVVVGVGMGMSSAMVDSAAGAVSSPVGAGVFSSRRCHN